MEATRSHLKHVTALLNLAPSSLEKRFSSAVGFEQQILLSIIYRRLNKMLMMMILSLKIFKSLQTYGIHLNAYYDLGNAWGSKQTFICVPCMKSLYEFIYYYCCIYNSECNNGSLVHVLSAWLKPCKSEFSAVLIAAKEAIICQITSGDHIIIIK